MDISPGANRYFKEKNILVLKETPKQTEREAFAAPLPGVLTTPVRTGRKQQVMFYLQHKGPHLLDS